MFSWLYTAIGTMLAWFNQITHSYAIALLLYALVFKIVLLPFAIKQQKNQIKQAKLRPKLAKIEKKYAGRYDRATLQKKQTEIQELQQKEGYNPLSGCLPLLIQFPLIIILYNIIRSPLEYICKLDSDRIFSLATEHGLTFTEGKLNTVNQIELVNKINAAGVDIGVKLPDFTVFGVNLAETPSFRAISILVLIPFLAAGIQWLSMFLTKKWSGNMQAIGQDSQSQASMKIMDLMLPLMTVFFAFNFSGMLGLYWIYQSALVILQTFILNKAMPLPTYSEEELREMERAAKEQQKAQKAAMSEQPRHKSLHYIDEDDYDELPTLANKAPEKPKKTGGIESAELKDDKKDDNE